MIPLGRVAPPIYRWQVRRRIYAWYSDLRELETRGRAARTVEERDAIMAALSQLQEDAGAIDVPLSYTDDSTGCVAILNLSNICSSGLMAHPTQKTDSAHFIS